jgi:hypothetical protein
MGTVFNECAERGPAFFDWPLDTVKTIPKKSRIRPWAPGNNLEEAWLLLLGRPFRGLDPGSYKNLADHDHRLVLQEGLKKAEDDQQYLYDFSFSDFNRQNWEVNDKDLGILATIGPELNRLGDKESYFNRFLEEHLQKGASCALLIITDKPEKHIKKAIRKFSRFDPEGKDVLLILGLDSKNDPLAINRLVTLKVILNAYSTAVMARSERIAGNTMTAFDPGDPRSIDRATAHLRWHVNDALKHPGWVKRHGILKPISYGEANAVLFDSILFMEKNRGESRRSFDIAPCIVRVLESLRLKKGISPEQALNIVRNLGLRQYLNDVTAQIK